MYQPNKERVPLVVYIVLQFTVHNFFFIEEVLNPYSLDDGPDQSRRNSTYFLVISLPGQR